MTETIFIYYLIGKSENTKTNKKILLLNAKLDFRLQIVREFITNTRDRIDCRVPFLFCLGTSGGLSILEFFLLVFLMFVGW